MRSDKAARNHHSGQCSPSRSTRSPSHPRHAHVHDVNPQVRVGKNTFTFGKAPLPPGVQRAAEQLRDDLEQRDARRTAHNPATTARFHSPSADTLAVAVLTGGGWAVTVMV